MKNNYLQEILTNKIPFDGHFFNWKLDHARLTSQMALIFLVIKDGKFRTVQEIQERIWKVFFRQCSQTSISAILRHFRKSKYGSHIVHTRQVAESGLFEYRFEFNDKKETFTEDSGQIKMMI